MAAHSSLTRGYLILLVGLLALIGSSSGVAAQTVLPQANLYNGMTVLLPKYKNPEAW